MPRLSINQNASTCIQTELVPVWCTKGYRDMSIQWPSSTIVVKSDIQQLLHLESHSSYRTRAQVRQCYVQKKKGCHPILSTQDLLALHISRRAKKSLHNIQEDLGSCSCQNDITIQYKCKTKASQSSVVSSEFFTGSFVSRVATAKVERRPLVSAVPVIRGITTPASLNCLCLSLKSRTAWHLELPGITNPSWSKKLLERAISKLLWNHRCYVFGWFKKR